MNNKIIKFELENGVTYVLTKRKRVLDKTTVSITDTVTICRSVQPQANLLLTKL